MRADVLNSQEEKGQLCICATLFDDVWTQVKPVWQRPRKAVPDFGVLADAKAYDVSEKSRRYLLLAWHLRARFIIASRLTAIANVAFFRDVVPAGIQGSLSVRGALWVLLTAPG